MPVIPYLNDTQAGPDALVVALRARRGGNLLNLDRLLLHSTPFAEGWGELLGRVRNGLQLTPQLRELAICAVAACCGAAYELYHHRPAFLVSGGTEQQFAALADPGRAAANHLLFDATQRQVLQLVLRMSLQAGTDTSLLGELRNELGDTQLLELVGVIAAYNMVARLVVALGVDIERADTFPGDAPASSSEPEDIP